MISRGTDVSDLIVGSHWSFIYKEHVSNEYNPNRGTTLVIGGVSTEEVAFGLPSDPLAYRRGLNSFLRALTPIPNPVGKKVLTQLNALLNIFKHEREMSSTLYDLLIEMGI